MINQFQLHCYVVNKLCDENECLFKLWGLIIINSNSQLVAQIVLTAQLGVDALMLFIVCKACLLKQKHFLY